MAFHDRADIFCFCVSRVSGTQMIPEIAAESGRFQKYFNVTCLTVADDIKRVSLGQESESLFQSIVNRGGMCQEFSVFFGAAQIDQFQLTLLRVFLKNHCGNVREQTAEQTFQSVAGECRLQIGFLFQNTVPCTGHSVGGIP